MTEDEETVRKMDRCVKWEEEPGQCSFHCTKPDSSAEKTAVQTLLQKRVMKTDVG